MKDTNTQHTVEISPKLYSMAEHMADTYKVSTAEMVRRLILNEYRIFTRTYPTK